jgi:excisionase family DNA binding protein
MTRGAIFGGLSRRNTFPQASSEETMTTTTTPNETAATPFAHIPEFLTAQEVGALLQIDVKTIYRYVQRGLIPYIRIQSNLRFRKREVLEWIARQSHPQRTAISVARRFRG